MTSPRCVTGGVDSSSEEELGEDWRQPSAESRVVYHYHLRHRPSTTRRWIRRTGDAAPEELNTQHQEQVVPSQETRMERGKEAEEQLRTEAEELTTPRGLEHGDLKTQHQEQLVPRQETRLERGKEAEEQLRTEAEELTTPRVQGDSELGESAVLPVHEARLEHQDPNTQHQELVVEDASVKAGDV